MKDVAVYAGYTDMLKGAGYRLAHLRGEIAIRIIWQAVILAVLICKFCLKKKIFSGNCCADDARPRAEKRVIDRLARSAVVGDRTAHALHGFLCPVPPARLALRGAQTG